MANVNLKTDFKDGEKLFGQQLNNNFSVIKAALEAVNKIAWQDDPDDSVTAFRGTTEEINQRDIIDGQLLYDTSTGETYIDVGSQRISTGSGNAIHIGSNTPTNPATQLWVDPNEPLQLIGTEVTNSMEGNESNKAPSVQAIKNYIDDIDDIYSTDEVKTNKVWINNKPIYRKVIANEVDMTNGSEISLSSVSDMSNLVSIQSKEANVSDDFVFYNNYYDSSTNKFNLFHYISRNSLYLYAGSGTHYTVTIIIEYTKTTD